MLCIPIVSGNEWVPNTLITNGLTDLGDNPRPSVFDMNGTLYLIAMPTAYADAPVGYKWNGLSWVSNTSIVNGLDAPSSFNTYRVYNNSGTFELYTVGNPPAGSERGFQWNGTSWVLNNSLVNTIYGNLVLDEFSCSLCVINIFNLSGTKTAIVGSNTKIAMLTWNGTHWNYNTSGSVDLGSPSQYRVTGGGIFQNGGNWNYITSNGTTSPYNYIGFFWNGTNWTTNSTNTEGLAVPTLYNVQTIFTYQGTTYLIDGIQDGTWEGYNWGNYSITLNSPSNGSSVSMTYPPLTASMTFSWSNISTLSPAYNILVAKDQNFNLIVVDTLTARNSSAQTLESGNYWWKVRYYDSVAETYDNYSDVFNFTLTATSSASSGSVEGVVYELLGSTTITPITGALVYIYNTTWSSYQITGSNGYYLFSGLKPDYTYTLYAAKSDYDTSVLSYVTINASVSQNDILMKKYISSYVPNFVYETIQIKNIFGTAYVGAAITLYEGDGLGVYATGTTDSLGQAVFRVIKDQKYRLTASGGGLSSSLTYYIYGKEEIYPITIMAGFPTIGDRFSEISTNLTVTNVNSTHKNLSLIYLDTVSTTSQIWFYATNLTTGETCTQSNTTNSVTLTCTVLSSGSYQFGFNATSTKYGYFQDNQIINFAAGTPDTPLIDTEVDKTLLQWTSIIILVVLASLFGVTTVKFGSVVVPMAAMALWVFGWFEPAQNNAILSFTILSTALIMGVLIYMRMSEGKAAYT